MVLALMCTYNGYAQPKQGDSSFYQTAINNAISLYQESEHDQARIFNAREYKPYSFQFIKGFPFFLSNTVLQGSIMYDGNYYDSVLLMYDEIKEMVILVSGAKLEFVNERIDYFTMQGHTFIRLQKDSINALPATGFYERLYSGNIEVYKKEKKSIKDVLSHTEGYQAEALDKQYYYIKKNNRYLSVKKKRQMMEVLGDKKNEIQQFIKSNRLNFKVDTDNTITAVAAFYDQLTR